MNIAIVADNFSMKWGGESSFPPIYAKLFRERGATVWIVCHARVRPEVMQLFPDDGERIRFVEDTPGMLRLFRIGQKLPYRVRDSITGMFNHMMSQRLASRMTRDLIREQKIDVVFQPTPISPKSVSYLYDLGVPVVIGPMCGGMNFPPAFRDMDSRFTRLAMKIARGLSPLLHRLVPGKLRADVLLVANEQTARALPPGCRGRVITVVESGVDLTVWSPAPVSATSGPVRFVFSGRFVDWKGVEFLVAAFRKVRERVDNCVLDLVGDGELGPRIREICAEPALKDHVHLHGWLSREDAARVVRECDVFVMPSLRECGGGAILEAMALGKPIIAAHWGGPGCYVNDHCGIRVRPSSRDAYVDGLADAMVRLAESADLRARLGQGSLERIRQQNFEWQAKGDHVFEILRQVARRDGASESTATPVDGEIGVPASH